MLVVRTLCSELEGPGNGSGEIPSVGLVGFADILERVRGVDGDQPFVLGMPEHNKARGWPAPAQHFATEVGITLVTLYTYMQVVPVLSSGKAHEA
ncbi:hypothetical protein TrST_g6138 [Triparma strigata]|uniref:Uncharacterized protein n=1 Tax=Triparma strigata TaxID=1606541 RepID=A0A9W7ATQ2_9STRA|nr:hypothetical protein TrST_g6138 [Triparma strigata]